MALSGGIYFNIGNKKLPVGRTSSKEIKKAFVSEQAEDFRKQYLEKNKNYNKQTFLIELKAEHYKQPKLKKKAKVVAEKQTNSLKELVRKTKYFFVSLLFFRLVARTPVDEDYWTYEKDSSKRPYTLEDIYYYATDPETGKRVVRKRSENAQYEHEKGVKKRFHKADDRRIRDEWYLKVGAFKVPFCSTDFKVDYDKYFKEDVYDIDSTPVNAIMNEIGKADDFPDFEDYEIWNTSPYFRTLEFGEYRNKDAVYKDKKDKTTKVKDFIGQGAERFHGTHKGYSVQAPLGLLGRTLAEFSELERLATGKKSGGEGAWANNYGYSRRQMRNFSLGKENKVAEKYKHRKYEVEVIDGRRFTTSYYEEDLVKAACEGLNSIPLDEVEVKPPYSKFYGTNTFAEEADKMFEKRKQSTKNHFDYVMRKERKEQTKLIRQNETKYGNSAKKQKQEAQKIKKELKEEVKDLKESQKVTGHICNETKESNLDIIKNFMKGREGRVYNIDFLNHAEEADPEGYVPVDVLLVTVEKDLKNGGYKYSFQTEDGNSYGSLSKYCAAREKKLAKEGRTEEKLTESQIEEVIVNAIKAKLR